MRLVSLLVAEQQTRVYAQCSIGQYTSVEPNLYVKPIVGHGCQRLAEQNLTLHILKPAYQHEGNVLCWSVPGCILPVFLDHPQVDPVQFFSS